MFLDLAVNVRASKIVYNSTSFNVPTFLYDHAIMAWTNEKEKRVFWLDVFYKTTLLFHDVD
jgi:hypothetical protein